MWHWRSRSAEEGQAAIAFLWPQLGPIKRAQATTGFRRFYAQYRSKGLKPRSPRRRRPTHVSHLAPPTASPDDVALGHAWAAGFLDGEGHFGLPRAGVRKTAPDWRRIRASASQHGERGLPPQVLFRLRDLLGGKIEVHGEPDDFRWLVEGVDRVEAVFAKVRPWLGTVKQDQAYSVIHGFRSQIRRHGDAARCARGHEYSRVYVSAAGPRRKCNACNRIRERKQRAAQGIKPRQFKNVARRYNF